MENYTNNIDMDLINELGIDGAREYLIGKYGMKFAEETMRVVEEKMLENEDL